MVPLTSYSFTLMTKKNWKQLQSSSWCLRWLPYVFYYSYQRLRCFFFSAPPLCCVSRFAIENWFFSRVSFVARVVSFFLHFRYYMLRTHLYNLFFLLLLRMRSIIKLYWRNEASAVLFMFKCDKLENTLKTIIAQFRSSEGTVFHLNVIDD